MNEAKEPVKTPTEQRKATPAERIVAVADWMAQLLGAIEESAKRGQAHPHAVYTKQKSNVITVDGKGDQVVLVGAVVPVAVLLDASDALMELRAKGAGKGGESEH